MKEYKKYFLSTGLFAASAAVMLKKLDTALRNYEAAQPGTCAEEVFCCYFGDNSKTSYREIPAGLGGEKKYLVCCDASPIAVFTLEPTDGKEKAAGKWQLKNMKMLSPCGMAPEKLSHMSDAQKKAAFGAFRARAEYMINAKGAAEAVDFYYDRDASAYCELTEIGRELWMNQDEGHSFHHVRLGGYIPYSEHLFSARVSATMNVYCANDDSYRDFPVDLTLYFYLKNDRWLCFEAANAQNTA